MRRSSKVFRLFNRRGNNRIYRNFSWAIFYYLMCLKNEHVYAIDLIRFRILVLTEAKEALIFDSHIHRDHIHRGPRRSAGQTQDIREVNEETPYHISCLPYFKELNNNAEG